LREFPTIFSKCRRIFLSGNSLGAVFRNSFLCNPQPIRRAPRPPFCFLIRQCVESIDKKRPSHFFIPGIKTTTYSRSNWTESSLFPFKKFDRAISTLGKDIKSGDEFKGLTRMGRMAKLRYDYHAMITNDHIPESILSPPEIKSSMTGFQRYGPWGKTA
jgi:hypothetical protein